MRSREEIIKDINDELGYEVEQEIKRYKFTKTYPFTRTVIFIEKINGNWAFHSGANSVLGFSGAILTYEELMLFCELIGALKEEESK